VIDTESITKPVAAVTAVMAMIGGGYSLYDKIKLPPKDVLRWDAEHFTISNGPASGLFRVVVARQKIRDDCTVEDFSLEVRDSDFIVHKASPSVAKFSGPASPTVDKFGYTMTIEKPEGVALGEAKLIARIMYKCPEGNVVIAYPDHKNLSFNIEGKLP
jgi:hypothetical protein